MGYLGTSAFSAMTLTTAPRGDASRSRVRNGEIAKSDTDTEEPESVEGRRKMRKLILLAVVLPLLAMPARSIPITGRLSRQGSGEGGQQGKKLEATLEMTGENLLDDRSQFREGDKIVVRFYLKNNSDEPVDILRSGEYAVYRPRLRKVGEGESKRYRSGLPQTLMRLDREESFGGSLNMIRLEPGKKARIEFIDLSRWYEDLSPGTYGLTILRRFKHEGKGMPQVRSNEVHFEIVPR